MTALSNTSDNTPPKIGRLFKIAQFRRKIVVLIDTRSRILDSSGTAALPLATRALPKLLWLFARDRQWGALRER
jgi:hypothetical protein